MSYFLAPSLDRLRGQVNAAFPDRDRRSDGWIGDPSHAARKSDHNPCWSCQGRVYGVVRAIDVDISPDGRADRDLAKELLAAAIGDPRTWYAIHDSVIYSRTYGFSPLRYSGHPHTEHVHVSIQGANGISADHAERVAFDTDPWDLDGAGRGTKDRALPTVTLTRARNAARNPSAHPVAVRRIQRALNAKINAGLTIDGVYGARTRAAYRAWEQRLGYRNPNAMPNAHSLTRLGAQRFKVAA